MSVGLDTTPLLTKNFAGGSSATGLLLLERVADRRMLAQPNAGGHAKAHEIWRVRRAGGPSGPRMIGQMLLAVDIGNTNISLAPVQGTEPGRPRRAQTRAGATPDELELLLDGLLRLDGSSLANFDRITVASVVPSLTSALRRVADTRRFELLVADAATVPIAIRVDRPAEVGADRLVNAFAASRLYGAPAIVIDFGTATNFDVVAADGAYVGGALAPGLELGVEALAAR